MQSGRPVVQIELCAAPRRIVIDRLLSAGLVELGVAWMADAATVDPKLLDILVCPLTKGPLDYDAQRQELVSHQARLAYPIRDGIPIMLPEEARQLDE